MDKACLAATIKERSNFNAGLEGRAVPLRDWRLWAIGPAAVKALSGRAWSGYHHGEK